MEFIEAKINPNSTLKNALKKVEGRSLKVKERRIKMVEKPTRGATTWHGRARPCQVAWSCHPARPGRATSLAGWSCWVLGARPCALLPFRVLSRFAPFCSSGCSGLPRSSNLPWNYFWSPLFHQNPMISPEMKTKRNLGTIWIKGR